MLHIEPTLLWSKYMYNDTIDLWRNQDSALVQPIYYDPWQWVDKMIHWSSNINNNYTIIPHQV